MGTHRGRRQGCRNARKASRRVAESLPADPAAALRATAVVDGIGVDRHVVRLLLRDLDDEPELRKRLWDEVRADVDGPFADRVAAVHGEGLSDEDARASAATLVAALTCGRPARRTDRAHAGEVDVARFVEAWTRLALVALGPSRRG